VYVLNWIWTYVAEIVTQSLVVFSYWVCQIAIIAFRISSILCYIAILLFIYTILFLLLLLQYLVIHYLKVTTSLQRHWTFHYYLTNSVNSQLLTFYASLLDTTNEVTETCRHPIAYPQYPNHYAKLHFKGEVEDFIRWEDILLVSEGSSKADLVSSHTFTAYKPVDRRVRPVSGTFPQEALVWRTFPHDPLEGLPVLSRNPPDFSPTKKITAERLKLVNVNSEGFLGQRRRNYLLRSWF